MIFPPNPEDYEILHQIGRNSISDFYSARCKTNNQIISIRIISMEQCPIDVINLRKGGSLWMASSHENLTRYYGSFEVGSSLWVISEFVDGGSIRDILRYGYNHGIKNETLISAILRPVLEFLSIFHQNMHIHRSINTDVILVKTDGTIKISNLSFASSLIEGGKRKGARFSLAYGYDDNSSCYAAPEVLSGSGYTQSSDIWSVGITAIELATGILPFENMTEMERIKAIIDGPSPTLQSVRDAQYSSQYSFDTGSKIRRSSSSFNKDSKASNTASNSNEFSPAFNDFIDQCLKKSPQKRPSVNRLLEHKFFKNMAINLNYNVNGNTNLNKLCKSYITRILMSQLPPVHEIFESLTNAKPASTYLENVNTHIKRAESMRGVQFIDNYYPNSNQNQNENYKLAQTKITSQHSTPNLKKKPQIKSSQTFGFLFDYDYEIPKHSLPKKAGISIDDNDWIFDSNDHIHHQSSSLGSLNEPHVTRNLLAEQNKKSNTSDKSENGNEKSNSDEIEIGIDKETVQVGRFKVQRISSPHSLPE